MSAYGLLGPGDPIAPPYLPPSEVVPGIWLVPIPIPIPLKYVNCYLCHGPTGWTIVDTGFRDDLARAAWPRALEELGIRPQEIDRILVTHYHPDHLGAAGWLQQLTGAPVYLHEPDLAQVNLFWGAGMAEIADELAAFFIAEGMPPEIANGIREHHHHQSTIVRPLPEITPIPTGSLFRVGAREYEVLWLPGHDDGLAVFWDAGTGILIANDMLLAKITPNVSLWPRGRTNPLADYLASLEKVAALNAKLALPGHRSLIPDVTLRAREIQAHHAHRLDLMAQACGTAGATGWEVSLQVFNVAELNLHQIRFAMSESLAHLVYMEKQGRLRRNGNRFLLA